MNPDKELTIILTLKDRVHFTLRWFKYANETRLPFHVIVADGGADKRITEILSDRSNFPNVDYEYVRYPFDATYPIYHAKKVDALSRVRTPYVAFTDNDDFLIVDGLRQAVTFLASHEDYATCKGGVFYLYLKPDPNALYGEDARLQYFYAGSLEQPTARERIAAHLARYSQTYYDVHRTPDALRFFRMLREIDFNDCMLSEIYTSLLAVATGKVKKLECLGLIRQDHSDTNYYREVGHSDFVDRYLVETWSGDFSRMTRSVAEIVAAKDGIPLDSAKREIARAYRPYMASLFWAEFSKELAARGPAAAAGSARGGFVRDILAEQAAAAAVPVPDDPELRRIRAFLRQDGKAPAALLHGGRHSANISAAPASAAGRKQRLSLGHIRSHLYHKYGIRSGLVRLLQFYWRNRRHTAGPAADVLTGLYDFSVMPFAVGDSLTWSGQLCARAVEMGKSAVDVCVLLDPSDRPSLARPDLSLPLRQRLAAEVFPAFLVNPMLRNIHFYRNRQELEKALVARAAAGAAVQPGITEYVDETWHRDASGVGSFDPINRLHAARGFAPEFKSPDGARQAVEALLRKLAKDHGCDFFVCVHLRQKKDGKDFIHGGARHRDARIEDWRLFFAEMESRRPQVMFLAVGQPLAWPPELQALRNLALLKSHGFGLSEELAAIEHADLYMGTDSGLSVMAMFGRKPYLIFQVGLNDTDAAKRYGVPEGARQLSFAAPHQMLCWGDTSPRLLAAEFDAMYAALRPHDRAAIAG